MILEEKIVYLRKYLYKNEANFKDGYKTDIAFFFDEFSPKNPMFIFLENLNSKKEIRDWVEKLTSRIVMKYDDEMDDYEVL
jgi:hypothetical protein